MDTGINVPFLDLKRINEFHREELTNSFNRVFDSGIWIRGVENASLENELGSCYGKGGFCLVGNGYDALWTILSTYILQGKLKKGDKVLIPSNTFIATALAVVNNGLNLEVCSVENSSYNLSPIEIFDALTPETKAVIVVNLYGRFNYDISLRKILNSKGILLIEDNAQSFGAKYLSRNSGSIGNASAFSFYPGKNFGALGDGGAIYSSDEDFIYECKMLSNYGSKFKYSHDSVGVNSRLDEIQAAFLRCKLKHINIENSKRIQIAQKYIDNMRSDVCQLPELGTFFEGDLIFSHVWHCFVLKFENVIKRNRFKEYMTHCGIETQIHYPKDIRGHLAFSSYSFFDEHFKNSEQPLISLPIFPFMEDNEVDYVIEKFNSFHFI